jgi:hypothetical protein
MAPGAFDDKMKPPQLQDLAVTLGKTFLFWNELKAKIEDKPISFEWGLYQQDDWLGPCVRRPTRKQFFS